MRIDLSKVSRSIAISLDFLGPQPNHFGADVASAVPMQVTGFVGDTRQGGSCNVDVIQMNPHCNGTHTETISHVVDELLPPHQVIEQPLMVAELITIEPQPAVELDANNTYQPAIEATDYLLGIEHLTAVIKTLHKNAKALIIRTLPNDKDKKNRRYDSHNQPAYFSNEAMAWLASETQIAHLLVDLPSVDRLHDEGLLSNHRLFWNLAPGSNQLSKTSWQHKTITEMVYVADDIPDGSYLLNLQVPKLNLNAVPSNPTLQPLSL